MINKLNHGCAQLAEAVKEAYNNGQTDYYLEPLALTKDGKPVGKIEDGDSVIFCCRRGEREIELTEMFTDPSFNAIERKYVDDLHFVMLTMYHEKLAHLHGLAEVNRRNRILPQRGMRFFRSGTARYTPRSGSAPVSGCRP